MARDTSDDTPITSKADLVERLEAGARPAAEWRIGTEHEKFPFRLRGHAPVPYDGEKGIRALLEGMERRSVWEPILDRERIIGLADPQGGGAISLEPGGQFELSGAPLETLHETARELDAHLADAHAVAGPLGIGFLGLGMSPVWRLDATPAMPKSRYEIMAAYMPKVGRRGLDMMFRTATVQVNLDFSSEADMAAKMRVSIALQPVATALFANSPFTDGAPNGRLSERAEVWRDVDRDRTGMLPFVFEAGFGFERYVDWALDVPMYFVRRDGVYHDATDFTFRQYLAGALRSRLPGVEPTLGDWDNHLSTLFPEVRLKRYIEMRGADCGPRERIVALSAFWTGLLYDADALAGAFDLVRGWSAAERQTMRDAVPTTALATPFRDGRVLDIARAALELSRAGLARRARMAGGRDETRYLAPLDEIVARGTAPAEALLRRWCEDWGGDIDRVFTAEAL